MSTINKLSLILIIFPLFVFGQEKTLFIQPSPTTIFIHWERLDKDQSFNLYRRSANSEYKLINKEPIKMLTHRSDIVTTFGENLNKYLRMFSVKYPEQIHEKLNSSKIAEVINTAILPELAIIRGNGYLDKNVVADNVYKYKIFVITGNQEIQYTKEVEIKAENQVPQKPLNFEANGGNEEILLSWEQPPGPNAGYDVFRALQKDGDYTQINFQRILFQTDKSRQPPKCNYVDKEVNSEKIYWYKVGGRDALGNLGILSDPLPAVASDKTPPAGPELDKIRLDPKGFVILKWQSRDMSGISFYKIYKSRVINDNGNIVQGKINKGVSTFTDTNLEPGFYWYRISALDKYGNEAFSNPEGVFIRTSNQE